MTFAQKAEHLYVYWNISIKRGNLCSCFFFHKVLKPLRSEAAADGYLTLATTVIFRGPPTCQPVMDFCESQARGGGEQI